MIVHLAADSPVPAYEQLRSQIAAAIAAQQLEQGHQLPPIRQLAKDLDLAPGTVARAYRELEASGLVESNGRRGTRVAVRPADAIRSDERLRLAAENFVAVATDLGMEPDPACDVVRAAFASSAAAGSMTRS